MHKPQQSLTELQLLQTNEKDSEYKSNDTQLNEQIKQKQGIDFDVDSSDDEQDLTNNNQNSSLIQSQHSLNIHLQMEIQKIAIFQKQVIIFNYVEEQQDLQLKDSIQEQF